MSTEILEYRLAQIERRLAALESKSAYGGWLTPSGAAIHVYYGPTLDSDIVGTLTGPRPYIRFTSPDENGDRWFMLSDTEFVRAGDVRETSITGA